MPHKRHSLGAGLLYAFALAWPFDALQYVPGTGLYLTEWLGLAIIIAGGIDVAMSRKLRLPFSVLWPCAVLGALVPFLSEEQLGASHMRALLCLALFIAAGQLTCNRTQRVHIAKLSVCTLALSLITIDPSCRLQFTMPTAFSLESMPSMMFGPMSVRDGVQSASIEVVLAIALAASASTWRWAAGWSVLAVIIGASVPWLQTANALWHPIALPAHLASAIAVCTLLWLIARLIANARVETREVNDIVAIGYIAAAALSVVLGLFAGWEPGPQHAVLLGLLAATRGVASDAIPFPRWTIAAVAPLLWLAGCNVWNVSPENLRDPRRYDLVAQTFAQNGRFDELRRYLGRVARLRHFRAEPRLDFWMAKSYLAEGDWLNTLHALENAKVSPLPFRPVLAVPANEEWNQLLDDLRDRTGGLAPRDSMLVYERALALAGKPASTISLLENAKLDPPTVPSAAFSQEQLIAVASALFYDDEAIANHLRGWSQDQLLALIQTCGAVVMHAQPGTDAHALPLVVQVSVKDSRRRALSIFRGDATIANVVDLGPLISTLRYTHAAITLKLEQRDTRTVQLVADDQTYSIELDAKSPSDTAHSPWPIIPTDCEPRVIILLPSPSAMP